MKKWFLLAFALLVLCVPASAQGLPLVVDNASLLTQDAVTDLTAEAQRLSDAYSMDVVILTTNSLDGKTARDFAADYFDEKGYGRGENYDGVLIMLSMEDRDLCISTSGSGIRAFTDYGIEQVSDDIVPYFSGGDYAGGFTRFLRDAEILLEQAKNGQPFDVENAVALKTAVERAVDMIPYLLIAALVVALIVLGVMIFRMKTARPQYSANGYVKDGSVQISRSQDLYLYHTQTRVRVQKSSSSSGGGSSIFTSSSGRSHGGGSRKF